MRIEAALKPSLHASSWIFKRSRYLSQISGTTNRKSYLNTILYFKEDRLLRGKFYVQVGQDNKNRAVKTDEAYGRRSEKEVNAK